MKPRLESAPYTYEDWDIMRKASRRWVFGKHPGHGIAHIYVPADRRDADLMFFAQRIRSYTFPVALPPLWVPSLDGPQGSMLCGGALAEWRTLNLGHFA